MAKFMRLKKLCVNAISFLRYRNDGFTDWCIETRNGVTDMTSWEWVDENPVMTESQFARFCKMQQMAGDDADSVSFRTDCEAFRVAGGFDSAQVVGAAGY